MTETLIQYKTAKLAKEKGFDIDLYPKYTFDKLLVLKYTNSISAISVPTQSLLQRWIREKHNINVIPCPTDRCIPFDRYKFKIWKNGLFISKSKIDFDTYEEALEEGLYNALTLINK